MIRARPAATVALSLAVFLGGAPPAFSAQVNRHVVAGKHAQAMSLQPERKERAESSSIAPTARSSANVTGAGPVPGRAAQHAMHALVDVNETKASKAAATLDANATSKEAGRPIGSIEEEIEGARVALVAATAGSSSSYFSVSSEEVSAASNALVGILLVVLLVAVFLRCSAAPDNGIELLHESMIGVDPEFSTASVAGRCIRAVILAYMTYFMYPGRVYAAFTRDPALKKAALFFMITGPALFPLMNLYVSIKNVFSPGETLEKDGFQADTPEACAAERQARGGLARFFHAFYFYTAMMNHKIWAGSTSPAETNILSKDHWRELLESVGAFVPPLLARYKGKTAEWVVQKLPDADVVVKPESGCLGEASTCFKKDDCKTIDDVQKKMEEFLESEKKNATYSKAGAEGEYLLLERALPDSRGVHLLEVCTAVDKSGRVGVMQITYFLDSNSFTSHEAASRYRVNATTGKIQGGEQWFRRRAMNDALAVASKRFGDEVPNAKEAIDLAIKAHEAEISINPGRKFLGWDCMFTNNGPCFFEGNTMELRMGRSLYNSWTGLWLILRTFSPPL